METATAFDARTLVTSTGARLALRVMPAAAPARGVIQINHGLAEHSQRYRRFAEALAKRGYHVYAHDHRGHGATRAPDGIARQFARERGVDKLIADVADVHAEIRKAHPGLPVIVFGHSLGSMVALNFAETHPENLAGLACWNINVNAGLLGRVAQAILGIEAMLLGSDVASRILPVLTFQAWGKAVPGHRTPFDWLSHDPAEVDKYIADPLCGWDATVSMWQDTFAMMYRGGENLARLPSDLPVQLVGGAEDPATNKGREVEWLARRMAAAGARDVSLTILPGTRHESLNEINREANTALFLDWADRVTG
jgi:Lysophospholipase